MDARDRWQILQARLTAARKAIDQGDRSTAMAELDAALELDGNFLAAHALRDRVLAMERAAPHPVPAPTRAPEDVASAQLAGSHAAPQTSEESPAAYAKFEERAKRRRIDRRLEAARAALAQRRLTAAAAALDEVIAIDPRLPELDDLTAQFDALRRSLATPNHGPMIAAAAVFALALFGAAR